MSFDLSFLLLRFGALVLLYLFLFQVVLAIRRELHQPARRPAGVDAARVPVARLVVVDPGKSRLAPGESLTLTPVTSIGRAGGNAIPLTDDFVSSEHALVYHRAQQWWVEDLGSRNGTFVNRRQLERPVILSPGDVIEVGSVHLRFERGGFSA